MRYEIIAKFNNESVIPMGETNDYDTALDMTNYIIDGASYVKMVEVYDRDNNESMTLVTRG